MTEKEAIEKCNFMNDALNFQRVDSDECSCALQMAIAALEGIQKYHAIGTVEECLEYKDFLDFLSDKMNPNDFETYLKMYNALDEKGR